MEIGLKGLKAVMAIARLGSFRAAALDLGMSTTALSHTISRQETNPECGCSIQSHDAQCVVEPCGTHLRRRHRPGLVRNPHGDGDRAVPAIHTHRPFADQRLGAGRARDYAASPELPTPLLRDAGRSGHRGAAGRHCGRGVRLRSPAGRSGASRHDRHLHGTAAALCRRSLAGLNRGPFRPAHPGRSSLEGLPSYPPAQTVRCFAGTSNATAR